jgi:predicted dehydrogenase
MGETIRVIQVGCGGMSRRWLEEATSLDDVEVVGLVDIRKEAAQERAEQFGLGDAAIGSDLTEMLERVKPDAVFDCTVPEAHTEVTLEALAHGCHVLGEKPLADSMAKAKKMVAAAREADRIYAVIQNRRYNENIRRLRNFLESGVIGPITTVNCDFYIGAHFGGFRDHMEHVLLLDMAIHTFDMARFLTGADAQAVVCKEWNPSGSWYDHDAAAAAIFEMTDGLVYNYRGSWCAEGLNTTWESDWRIIGENGSVTWDGATGYDAQVVEETGEFFSKWRHVKVPPYDPGDKVGGHGGLIREFVRSIQTGGTPETVCTDNIKSLAMVFGAIESSEQRKFVDIEV